MQAYFVPKENIFIINGNEVLRDTSKCFINYTYDIGICIKKEKQYKLRKLFISCLKNTLADNLKYASDYCIKNNLSLYKTVFSFYLGNLSQLEVSNYFREKTIKTDLIKLINDCNKYEFTSCFIQTEGESFCNVEDVVITNTIPGYIIDQISVIRDTHL